MIWGLVAALGKQLVGMANKRSDQQHQLNLELVGMQRESNATKAAQISHAMSFKVFWVAWALFAFPCGLWFAVVMVDTMTPPDVLNMGVPMLPATIKPYFDLVVDNLFYSGGAVGIAQVGLRGILSAFVK